MDNKGQAIKPVFNLSSYVRDTVETKDKDVTEEEKILSAGSLTPFWHTLKEHVNKQINELDQINEAAIANGATRDQVGENTIVISMTKGVLRKIFNVVDDAREAVEEAKGGKE